mmetsp:Transcript_63877/g.164434  ORF Transcript_63877/g.164434 Transcript_63877/m.164434 type:complete len:285 (-) Transcript_63877:53-907(-)
MASQGPMRPAALGGPRDHSSAGGHRGAPDHLCAATSVLVHLRRRRAEVGRDLLPVHAPGLRHRDRQQVRGRILRHELRHALHAEGRTAVGPVAAAACVRTHVREMHHGRRARVGRRRGRGRVGQAERVRRQARRRGRRTHRGVARRRHVATEQEAWGWPRPSALKGDDLARRRRLRAPLRGRGGLVVLHAQQRLLPRRPEHLAVARASGAAAKKSAAATSGIARTLGARRRRQAPQLVDEHVSGLRRVRSAKLRGERLRAAGPAISNRHRAVPHAGPGLPNAGI